MARSSHPPTHKSTSQLDLLCRLNLWLEVHAPHWLHGACMVLSNVLAHVGHGHTPWGW